MDKRQDGDQKARLSIGKGGATPISNVAAIPESDLPIIMDRSPASTSAPTYVAFYVLLDPHNDINYPIPAQTVPYPAVYTTEDYFSDPAHGVIRDWSALKQYHHRLTLREATTNLWILPPELTNDLDNYP